MENWGWVSVGQLRLKVVFLSQFSTARAWTVALFSLWLKLWPQRLYLTSTTHQGTTTSSEFVLLNVIVWSTILGWDFLFVDFVFAENKITSWYISDFSSNLDKLQSVDSFEFLRSSKIFGFFFFTKKFQYLKSVLACLIRVICFRKQLFVIGCQGTGFDGFLY